MCETLSRRFSRLCDSACSRLSRVPRRYRPVLVASAAAAMVYYVAAGSPLYAAASAAVLALLARCYSTSTTSRIG